MRTPCQFPSGPAGGIRKDADDLILHVKTFGVEKKSKKMIPHPSPPRVRERAGAHLQPRGGRGEVRF